MGHLGVVDHRGWIVPHADMPDYDSIPNNPTASPRYWQPRRWMPWSPAEDRALLVRARSLEDMRPDLNPYDRCCLLAKEHQRSGMAIQSRLHSLRTGLRLAALAKLDGI